MVRYLLWLLSLAIVAAQVPIRQEGSAAAVAFENFKARFGRTYGVVEDHERFGIFQNNFAKIEAHNAQNLSYELAVTQFSDLTHEEFSALTAGARYDVPSLDTPRFPLPAASAELPDDVDWVAKGAVTPVKDQGGCGSCWAFATTGALEGAYFVAAGQLVSISEQEFVSCYGKTCIAGAAWEAMRWAKKNSLCTEASYPYGPYPGTKPLPPISACKSSSCDVALPAGAVTGYAFVTPKNELALMEAVSQQPVAVSVDADGFQQYSKGIISGQCAQYRTDHAVLVVGYGAEGGVDYWKVKNSFGTDFGEHGYFRVQRHDKVCSSYGTGGMGILTNPVVPTVSNKTEIVV